MTPIATPLTRAKPGAALTAGAWNGLVAGIEGLYGAVGDADRAYVAVDATYRGTRLPGARVGGVPLSPAGPPLTAIAPIGPLATHALVGVRAGTWRIVVEALGFATETVEIDVDPVATGPSAEVAVELTRTTVPAPDLVGLPMHAASALCGWAGLACYLRPFAGRSDEASDDWPILMQSPSGGEIPRATAISCLHAAAITPRDPASTIVPDLLGWPTADLPRVVSTFQLTPIVDWPSGSATDPRVISQSLLPGTSAPHEQTIRVGVAAFDRATATFASFPGTHPALHDTAVQTVRAKIDSSDPELAEYSAYLVPWAVGRTYAGDKLLGLILDVFAGFGASVSEPRQDLEAIWRSFVVALAWY